MFSSTDLLLGFQEIPADVIRTLIRQDLPKRDVQIQQLTTLIPNLYKSISINIYYT